MHIKVNTTIWRVCSIVWKEVSTVVLFELLQLSRILTFVADYSMGAVQRSQKHSWPTMIEASIRQDCRRMNIVADTWLLLLQLECTVQLDTMVRCCVGSCTPCDTVEIRCVVALRASGGLVGRLICDHILGTQAKIAQIWYKQTLHKQTMHKQTLHKEMNNYEKSCHMMTQIKIF